MQQQRYFSYKIAEWTQDISLLRMRCMMLDNGQGKSELAYSTQAGTAQLNVYYDPEILKPYGNLLIHIEGPKEQEVKIQSVNLERLLGVVSRDLTEEEEDEILPKVLIR